MPHENESPHREAENVRDEINWLDGDHTGKWREVKFDGDMSDRRVREKKVKIVTAYIRGWLEIYNDEYRPEPKHRLKRVEIRNNYGEDTRFTVKAYIDPPPAERDYGSDSGNGGGSHLVPDPPPPPPDNI